MSPEEVKSKANFCGNDYKVALCFLLGVGELRH